MADSLGRYGRIARVAFLQAYSNLNPLIYIMFMLVRPVSQVIFFGLAARFATGQADVTFQVVGNAVQVCALSAVHTTAGVLVDERSNGTLALVTLAARQKFAVFAGRLLVVGMHGLLTSVAALALTVPLFGVDVGQVAWGSLLLSLVVTVLATSGLGVALGSLGLVLTDLNLVGNIVAVGVMAICGINFPVSALPGWLQVVAYALPLTRGAEAARLAMAGGGPGLWPLLAGELAVGAAWLVVGYGLYRYLERKAQVHGTLDLY
jgi:ABC-2 type transport system permease protein